MATAIKQVQENVSPMKVDPKFSEDSFQKQLFEAQQKVQKLELELKEVKYEYREYRVENDGYK